MAAVERFVRFVFPQWSKEEVIEHYVVSETPSFFDVLESYEAIAQFMESKTSAHTLRHSIALLDLPLPDLVLLGFQPNPLSISEEKRYPAVTLASLLALAFPEVRWLFFQASESASPGESQREVAYPWVCSDSLKEVFEPRSNLITLFDPSGLRQSIRECASVDPETSSMTDWVLPRHGLAAAIDDEEAYAFLHGYVAYRLGYRCRLVTTKAAMVAEFGRKAEAIPTGAASRRRVDLTFEDIFLNFFDRTSDEPHLSILEKRDDLYDGLKAVRQRLFVTSGHKHIAWADANEVYIAKLRSDGKKVAIVYKPTGGMYNILETGKLLGSYWRRRLKELKAVKPDTATLPGATGHSAPGRLLLIAQSLISRANIILNEAQSVPDCVHGATLALEAQELLAYRTPTTSLEAVALRHQLETKAECLFYGVGYSKDVKNRLREIEYEVNTVARWAHPSIRKASALSARLAIVTEVMRILRDFGQFDEEQVCLNHLRKLHRQQSLVVSYWWGPFYPIRLYIETLIGSFPLFLAALITWPIAFGLISYVTGAHFADVVSLSDHLIHAFITFFGLQPSGIPKGPSAKILTPLIVLMGFLHLGIFISHLYTLISRR